MLINTQVTICKILSTHILNLVNNTDISTNRHKSSPHHSPLIRSPLTAHPLTAHHSPFLSLCQYVKELLPGTGNGKSEYSECSETPLIRSSAHRLSVAKVIQKIPTHPVWNELGKSWEIIGKKVPLGGNDLGKTIQSPTASVSLSLHPVPWKPGGIR